METERTLHLEVEESNHRLDSYISWSCRDLSRSYIQKLIDEGFITVNDQAVKPSYKPRVGDIITINLPPPQPPASLLPEIIPLAVFYEDIYLLVIDNPAGITVHPAPGNPDHTLVNAVLAHYPDILALDTSLRPGIVHRLDKNTSGLMVVAKRKEALMKVWRKLKDNLNFSLLAKY